VAVWDFDGSCHVDRDDALLARLRSMRRGPDGAFILSHDGDTLLCVHVNEEAAILVSWSSRSRSAAAAAELWRSAAGGRRLGMTLYVALLVVLLALGVGVAVGRSRGPIVGIAMGLGVLVAGGIGYVGLLALALPM